MITRLTPVPVPAPIASLMTNHLLLLVLLIFALTLFFISPFFGEKASVRRHRRYRACAERVLQRLPLLDGDGQRLTYLRKINPYVYEELLLLAFERQGMTVIRNKSYSGDGGFDGQVFINNERWLIQAKRYSRPIVPEHIREFAALLAQERCRGLFIHTGRTGDKSRALLRVYSDITIISGERLLKLLAGKFRI
ncbi:TPA: restriction endonuclease [Salmonella enterica]|uniref:restriction endonuclease n=1 Tax=Salmonella enterica TaxID=28901 RepID=UPI0009B0AEA7|nr:restriction endonuclease [Salmonella enterica]HBD1844113.1 restriction endonuclease [Salmonella enterica]